MFFPLKAILISLTLSAPVLLLSQSIPPTCDTVTVVAGEHYKSDKLHHIIFGKQYRKEWNTPVRVPCFKISEYKGGLTPVKVGGGRQTISLRLMDKDSIQYQLRSVDKDPSDVLPGFLTHTFLEGILQDMMSTQHPYAMLVVPKLAKALGLYHTNPQLFFVPDDPHLGQYRPTFSGMLATLEIRPDEDLSQYNRFGNSKNVIGTEKLYEKLPESNRNRVDQLMYAKARLFDMLLNDWDRHEDQWRWAEYEVDGGLFYQPVPRDRDQVFSKYEGWLSRLLSSRWALRYFQSFGKNYSDLIGTNLNARYLDRLFSNELTKDQWLEIAMTMQNELTDSIIVDAVLNLPPELIGISAKELISNLIIRRNKLQEVAGLHYLNLANETHINGSEEDELFKIDRDEHKTVITAYRVDKEGIPETIIYRRAFYPGETDRIYLHGLGGHNTYEFRGSQNSIGITIFSADGNNKYVNLPAPGKLLTFVNRPSEIYEKMVYEF